VYFLLSLIAAGLTGISVKHKMYDIKRATFMFQQHNNAQYRIATISVKLIAVYAVGYPWPYAERLRSQPAWLTL
jgi:hypothetical protein